MSERKRPDVQPGDHVVFTGRVTTEGGREAVLVHDNGQSEMVIATPGDGSGFHDRRTEWCEASGASNVSHVVGLGHPGPGRASCDAFRKRFVEMFGEHPLDPDHPDWEKRRASS